VNSTSLSTNLGAVQCIAPKVSFKDVEFLIVGASALQTTVLPP